MVCRVLGRIPCEVNPIRHGKLLEIAGEVAEWLKAAVC